MGFAYRTPRRMDVTVEYVRTLLDYNPGTGVFLWKMRPGRRCIIGANACAIQKGRNTVKVGKGRFYASHLAWLYVYGVWPVGEIDHRDKNKLHDAIDNLRETTTKKNMMNIGITEANKSGFKGVSAHRDGFTVWIRADGYRYYLGKYDTAEVAAGAYRIAAAAMHAEFSGI